jgi:hypothetical protein
MPRLLALCLVLVALLPALAALAADPASPSSPGILPPTAPNADFNEPGQSSGLVAAMHIRGPEKIIGTAVVLLLLIALVMFIGMLRHVYGGPRARRR